MNPLTNVRNIKKLNEQELQLGIFNEKLSWHNQYKDSAYIFIGGLPYELTEGDILCVFSQYGEIVNINLVRDKKTGKSKGYGFIAYEDQRSTILSVDNLNGIKLGGRTIRVDHVEEYRKPKSDEKDESGKYIDKAEEGCAPKTPPPSSSSESEEEEAIKKVNKLNRKHKKDKKKKKRKKHKRSDEEESKPEQKQVLLQKDFKREVNKTDEGSHLNKHFSGYGHFTEKHQITTSPLGHSPFIKEHKETGDSNERTRHFEGKHTGRGHSKRRDAVKTEKKRTRDNDSNLGKHYEHARKRRHDSED